jgi:hypothetical protein
MRARNPPSYASRRARVRPPADGDVVPRRREESGQIGEALGDVDVPVKARWREVLTVALLVVRARQPHVAHLDVGAHHLGRAALARTVHPRRAEWRALSVRFLVLLTR